jgi:hypothetical protein
MYKMSALCCETCLNSFKQILGNLLQSTLLNVVNCFTNILFHSLQVKGIVGIHNTFEFPPPPNKNYTGLDLVI